MKTYEYMAIWFKGAHGGFDPTPPVEVLVAKLNELGAQGWRPAGVYGGVLMREISQDAPRTSRPMSNLVTGAKPAE